MMESNEIRSMHMNYIFSKIQKICYDDLNLSEKEMLDYLATIGTITSDLLEYKKNVQTIIREESS